jgi:DNA-binding protein H-NS
MSVRIDKKLSKLSEKMANLQKEIEQLEALKIAKLDINSDEIQTLVRSIQLLAQKHEQSIASIAALVQKACRGERTTSEAKKQSTLMPKYRDPMEYSNTWTGRGIEPLWLQRYTSNGRNRNEFLIKH